MCITGNTAGHQANKKIARCRKTSWRRTFRGAFDRCTFAGFHAEALVWPAPIDTLRK